MKTDNLLTFLEGEAIETWFDLGLFLDRVREEQAQLPAQQEGNYDLFKEQLKKSGLAFLTFHYRVDGVTVEADKYASLLRRNIPGIGIHYVAGNIDAGTAPFIRKEYKRKVIPELAGFDEWDLYHDLFFKKLERGGPVYNALVKKLWKETLTIVKKLGCYVEEEGIGLFYVINVCSNPGNLSYALALILLSEFMKIPVINNNHDFYWEGGMSDSDRKKSGRRPGPRDFFFTNHHLGEVFSIIDTVYPWQSRIWLNININKGQSEHLVRLNGHNPAKVMEIGTAVDTKHYTKNDKRQNINTFIQLEEMLSGRREQLISHSVNAILEKGLVSKEYPKPVLIGETTTRVKSFIKENIILLQPTRIISRKRIETSFNLLQKMFQEDEMVRRFRKTAHLKLTLIITGPVAPGHSGYCTKLVEGFGKFLKELDPGIKNRVYLALLFGALDMETYKAGVKNPAGIAEFYNIASLVLLPSKTEGRGLPILEATACGTPIFCRRYEPEKVYSEVIGEHLEERDRLKVLEFKGKSISSSMARRITDRIFFPNRYTDEIRHNQRVILKRYSLDALNENIYQILHRLYQQLQGKDKILRIVRENLEDYKKMVGFSSVDLDALLDTRCRQYLPGYSKLGFMIMLKSLIDPSYFRVEEQRMRGMAFHFARSIVSNDPDSIYVPDKIINRFYNAVDLLFEYKDGSVRIQHDHSMAYRHRNMHHYPFRDFTFQELTGLINLLYISIVQPSPINKVDLSPQFFTDWNLALMQLTGSTYLGIDNRKRLIEKLRENLPIAYFPGAYIMYELEFFALQSIRSRMHLPLAKNITRKLLEKEASSLKPVYIFAQEKNLGKQLNKDEITDYIIHGISEELRLLYEYKVIQIIRTKQVCVGIHFPQLGGRALQVLRTIRDEGGYILTNRSNAAMMTDLVDMDRFHIGSVSNEFTAHMMGIPVSSGYIQFVPAGVRATLSYPVPVQTAKDFDRGMHSRQYRKLVKRLGEKVVLAAVRKDAAAQGSPLSHVLNVLDKKKSTEEHVSHRFLSGIYKDKQPYNGALVSLNFRQKKWKFSVISTPGRPRTVGQFAGYFKRQQGKAAHIAWNGGFILNPELAGKLGLPETYIGSPLGLLIKDGKMTSAPLFNKPAFLVYRDGRIAIKRVNCRNGLKIKWKGDEIIFQKDAYNCTEKTGRAVYYDLMYEKDFIAGRGRTIVRLSGNVVKEIFVSAKGEKVGLVPVGLTLAMDPELVPEGLKAGEKVELMVPGMEEVNQGVEAGPLLLEDGRCVLDMELEGWKTANSIRTQAARLDYTEMRGPKIAVGLNKNNEMKVLTINGRIRESVGATHQDMAEILQQEGMEQAMGFDPGGSSTLVLEGKTLNISPYNSRFEQDIYAQPPEPRAVSNVLIGFLEE